MIRYIKNPLRRFRDSEDGSMVVPVALWTPVFFGLILSTIELGTVTIRHTILERSLDMTIRDVRLGTGYQFSHATLKQTICDEAAILPDCMDNLHLEMVSLNMRDWTAPIASADCVDTTQAVTPQRTFQHGDSNEMMLIRACYKFKPFTPAAALNASLPKDSEGYTALVSYSAFVHEPI